MSSTTRDSTFQAERGGGIRKIATGIQGLDVILQGGLPIGRTILFSGGPGTGKTVLAMDFLCRRALADEPGVFVSFEERAEELRINAAAMMMDVASLEQANTLRVVHAQVPYGAIRTGDFSIEGLLAILEGHIRACNARYIVLDAVDVLMQIFADPNREREEIYILNDWVRDRGMTVILTVKTNPANEQIYPFLNFMADCVLFLDQRTVGEVRTRRLSVLKYRGSGFLSNEHPYVFSDAGIVLMPVSSLSLGQGAVGEWVSSGNQCFDSILGGGYRRGSCVLLAGASGTGKTTMACTFARAACQRGEPVLYVGLEESENAIVANMQSVGIDLRPARVARVLEVLTVMPESVGVEEHLLHVDTALTAFQPCHLIVDAISACERMGSKHAAFDFCVRVLTLCKERNITCVFINQVTEAEQTATISGFGISSLVDTSIVQNFVDDGNQRSRRLLVVKSRGAKHSMHYHPFNITSQGIELISSSELVQTKQLGDVRHGQDRQQREEPHG